jgi:plasmid stabilization system protein ParE
LRLGESAKTSSTRFEGSSNFPAKATNEPISLHGRSVFRLYAIIAYAPDERPLLIIAVLHGRRSPRVIAAILRERK